MDSIFSWLLLLIIAFSGMGYLATAILKEVESRQSESERLWRIWEDEMRETY